MICPHCIEEGYLIEMEIIPSSDAIDPYFCDDEKIYIYQCPSCFYEQ